MILECSDVGSFFMAYPKHPLQGLLADAQELSLSLYGLFTPNYKACKKKSPMLS